MKPMFISVGYKSILDIVVEIALRTTKDHKQPEPLFLGDLRSSLSKISSNLMKNCFNRKNYFFTYHYIKINLDEKFEF